jgi:hypothetical protein
LLHYAAPLHQRSGSGEKKKESEEIVRDLRLCSTSLEEHDVAVLHDVLLALCLELSSGLYGRLVAELLQVVVLEDDRLDERLLEVYFHR